MLRNTTKNNRSAKTQISSVSHKTLFNLNGQLPRGGHNQGADGPGAFVTEVAFVEQLENRNGESGCFSSAGLCNAEQVALFEQIRNGLLLNRRRRSVTFRIERLQNRLNKV